MPYKPEMIRVQGPGGITITKKIMAQTEPSSTVIEIMATWEVRFYGRELPFHEALCVEERQLIKMVAEAVEKVYFAKRRSREIDFSVGFLAGGMGASSRQLAHDLSRLYSMPDWMGNTPGWPWSVNQGLYSNEFSSIIRDMPRRNAMNPIITFNQTNG
jgi:hypothetical protein